MVPKPKKRKELSFEDYKKFVRKTHTPVVTSTPMDRGIARYEASNTGGKPIYSTPKKMSQTLGSQKKTKSGYVGSTRYK